jgi:thioredoxin 1
MFLRLSLVTALAIFVIGPAQARFASKAFPTVTEADFGRLTSGSQLPIVVIVGAEWCAPCRETLEEIEQLQAEMKGTVRIAVLDADASPNIAKTLNITTVPVTLMYKDGKQISNQAGRKTKEQFVEWINATLHAGVTAESGKKEQVNKLDPNRPNEPIAQVEAPKHRPLTDIEKKELERLARKSGSETKSAPPTDPQPPVPKLIDCTAATSKWADAVSKDTEATVAAFSKAWPENDIPDVSWESCPKFLIIWNGIIERRPNIIGLKAGAEQVCGHKFDETGDDTYKKTKEKISRCKNELKKKAIP